MKIKKPLLRLSKVTHSRGAKELFADIDFTITSGQVVGLIGPNGVGKSTLLGIMTGEVEPRSGSRESRGEIAVVSQGIDADESMTVFDYIATNHELEEREVMVALGKVGGDEIDVVQTISTLSGGQKTKIRIAKCLLDEVDILLLDEPTNHLDAQGIKALQGFINRFHGPVVIVSHDRQFLDDVVTDIFDLRFGRGDSYVGSYSSYMKERELRAQKQMERWNDQEEKRKKAEKRLSDLRQRASFYDNPRRGKLLRSRQKMYTKEFVDTATEKPEHEKSMAMAVSGGTHAYKKILTLHEGLVGRVKNSSDSEMKPVYVDLDDVSFESGAPENKLLYMNLNTLELLGKDRVVIVGGNGSGKSSLLHVLKGCLPDEEYPEGSHELIQRGRSTAGLRIGRFAQQDVSLKTDERVMKRCLRMFPDGRDESLIRSRLMNAGIPTEDLVKKMSQLSYGQRVKIRFLQLMLHAYDLLILDEPTNHLDIATRESLEFMIQQYEGALIVVSHDRRFVEEVGIQKQWSIADGEMQTALWESTRKSVSKEVGDAQTWARDNNDQENESDDDAYDFMR